MPVRYLIKTGYFRQSLPPDTPIRNYKHDMKQDDRKTIYIYIYIYTVTKSKSNLFDILQCRHIVESPIETHLQFREWNVLTSWWLDGLDLGHTSSFFCKQVFIISNSCAISNQYSSDAAHCSVNPKEWRITQLSSWHFIGRRFEQRPIITLQNFYGNNLSKFTI